FFYTFFYKMQEKKIPINMTTSCLSVPKSVDPLNKAIKKVLGKNLELFLWLISELIHVVEFGHRRR
ncbi:hypothetical protein JOC59_001032, partial [Weissella beninensis]|nr:hypothetical protein [Periweissella beninensis]